VLSNQSGVMRIDAHQHFWHIADRAGAWPPPALEAIHRDFGPDQLAPLLERHGVAGTILVQSLPKEEDTLFLLDLASRHAFIRGVVGWADLKRGDAAARIAALARDTRLVGLRPMLQDLGDDDWIADEALAPAVRAMLRHRLSFDALVLPRHLPPLLAFATRFPELPLVIDHAAKPPMTQDGMEAWRTALARLAALPQVHCKLSGLVTEAGANRQGAAQLPHLHQLRPWVDTILGLFGPDRVIWGSDWPVLNLASDYTDWIHASEALLAGLDEAERRKVFGLNALRFYRIL
jgi:L-fuconolactonase